MEGWYFWMSSEVLSRCKISEYSWSLALVLEPLMMPPIIAMIIKAPIPITPTQKNLEDKILLPRLGVAGRVLADISLRYSCLFI